MDVGFRVEVDPHLARFRVLGEGARGAFGAEIARDGVLHVGGGHGRAPQAERRGQRRTRGVVEHENAGLQPFHRLRRAQQRYGDEGRYVGREAPQHAMCQRLEAEIEQRARRQKTETEGAGREDIAREPAGLDHPRQQQRVGPDEEAGEDPRDGAAGRGVAPEQAADESRGELRDGRKRDETDGGEPVCLSQGAVEDVGQQEDAHDGQPANIEEVAAEVLDLVRTADAPLQHQGHDEAVAHHDR